MSIAAGQLSGATYPTRGAVCTRGNKAKDPNATGAHRRKGAQPRAQGGNLYTSYADNADGQAPWIWNPALTAPKKRSTRMSSTMSTLQAPYETQRVKFPETQRRKSEGVNDCVEASRVDQTGPARLAWLKTSREAAAALDQNHMTGNQKHPNLLHTLRTGQMNNYTFRYQTVASRRQPISLISCRLPYTSATATTPGVYLPKVVQQN